jgi:hypothetical protein
MTSEDRNCGGVVGASPGVPSQWTPVRFELDKVEEGRQRA